MSTVPALLFTLALACPAPAQDQGVFDDEALHSFELTFHQADYWAQLSANYPGTKYIPADLIVDGKVLTDVGVRLRGNATYQCTLGKKKPFRIQTDAFVPARRSAASTRCA